MLTTAQFYMTREGALRGGLFPFSPALFAGVLRIEGVLLHHQAAGCGSAAGGWVAQKAAHRGLRRAFFGGTSRPPIGPACGPPYATISSLSTHRLTHPPHPHHTPPLT